jgi:sugar-specific transcriptional regulator TrmB
MLHNKDTEALCALGLTASQAKVYLALAKLGEERIQTISQTIQIARQDIYRIMAELEQQCLVEKVIATPTRFKAIPVHEAVPLLLQRMQQRTLDAQKKATQFTERHHRKVPELKIQEEETKFVLVSEKTALSRKIKKSIDEAQISVDILCPRQRAKFLRAMFDLSSTLKKAMERNVSIRWIINKPIEANARPIILEYISNSTLFELRYIPHKPTQTYGIYDRK